MQLATRMWLRRAACMLSLVLGMSSPALTACDFVNTSTKVGRRELYSSGDGRYDPYFDAVHREQESAAKWPEESKAGRAPVVTALGLRPGTSNSSVLAAARARKGDAALGRAVDETTAAERQRARKLTAAAERLEDLRRRGEDLRREAVADEQKVAKADEVKREMSAAVSAVDSMADDARSGAKEASELARKLRGAWTGKEDEEPLQDEPPKSEPVAKKPAPPAKKRAPAAESPPRRPPAARPAEKEPPPRPAPTQKAADDVFTP